MTRRNALLLIPVLLGACATDDALVGAAVTNNIVAQTVDLNPQYAGVPMEGSNGERATNAYRRYLKGIAAPLTKSDGKNPGAMAGGAPQQ